MGFLAISHLRRRKQGGPENLQPLQLVLGDRSCSAVLPTYSMGQAGEHRGARTVGGWAVEKAALRHRQLVRAAKEAGCRLPPALLSSAEFRDCVT